MQNHVERQHLPSVSGVADEDTHFDGYSCGWWSDEAAYEATMASEGWQALVADGENVFDMTWLDGMSGQCRARAHDHRCTGSPYKVVWMVSFKEGMTRASGDRSREQYLTARFQGSPN